MARILSSSVNADFLSAYKVQGLGECAPESLTIKVWDLYGAGPKDGDAPSGTGKFIAAVVYCDGCDKSVELDRAKLGG